MRVGLMGGTFDPVHLGHLITAEEIMAEMDLDRVIFIPSSLPPHKKGDKSMIAHRMRMAMMAVCSNPAFEVSDYEVKKGGVSYSLDTILHMKSSMAGVSGFFLYSARTLFMICPTGRVHRGSSMSAALSLRREATVHLTGRVVF